MTRTGAVLLAAGVVTWLAGAAPARAEWVILPPRPGQVGVGAQGQYGLMLKSGSVGETFDRGPGLAVRMRYRMRYERAIGLSFEGQRFDLRGSGAGTDSSRASVVTAGLDFYQMFGTRTRTTRMVSVGAGLAKLSVKLRDGESVFPHSDGVYVSGGVGVERFFWRSWAYDLSFRYMAVFLGGEANHDLQASLGLIFYAGY